MSGFPQRGQFRDGEYAFRGISDGNDTAFHAQKRQDRQFTLTSAGHGLPPNVQPYVPSNRVQLPTGSQSLPPYDDQTARSATPLLSSSSNDDYSCVFRGEEDACSTSPSRTFSSIVSEVPSSSSSRPSKTSSAAASVQVAPRSKPPPLPSVPAVQLAKRPANSWILYRQEKHPIVLAKHAGITNNEISKVVATMWRTEAEEVKDVYKKRAEEERRRHKIAYPDYKYAPNKTARVRKRKAKGEAKATRLLESGSEGERSAEDDDHHDGDKRQRTRHRKAAAAGGEGGGGGGIDEASNPTWRMSNEAAPPAESVDGRRWSLASSSVSVPFSVHSTTWHPYEPPVTVAYGDTSQVRTAPRYGEPQYGNHHHHHHGGSGQHQHHPLQQCLLPRSDWSPPGYLRRTPPLVLDGSMVAGYAAGPTETLAGDFGLRSSSSSGGWGAVEAGVDVDGLADYGGVVGSLRESDADALGETEILM
ncbi:hypothetical protein HKX48_002354, partial [Thoreauomyces humboldtii]